MQLTSEDDQAEAPVSVSQSAPPQQDLLVVQGVLLPSEAQGTREAIQTVVGGLTAHLT